MNAPVPIPDASDLPAVIERARNLFDAGDVKKARILAAMAGAEAKAHADVAKRFGVAGDLVRKARRLQGDALLIEARAGMRIADEYDAAQERGEAAKPGRPKNVADTDIFTAKEAGLDRREIAELRKLRDAEAGEPGIVQRAIEARLARGLEPTRRNLGHAIGTRTASDAERGNNLYETPLEAVRTLLALESFSRVVLEPACGKGAICRPMEDAGYEVRLSDLVDYGTVTGHGECHDVGDFLSLAATGGNPDIVTNPPYGKVMNAFIAHALREHRPRKMAMLLNLNALCGWKDADRNFWLDEWPPARVWVFSRRLPMMHRDGWDGNEAESQMNTAWFVWERAAAPEDFDACDRPYGDVMSIARVDWKQFQDAKPLAPEGTE